tara:strand:- start:182 stop:1615 length:1434 start_codon:yes stop_codon:yes gene_type:complete
MKIKIKNITKRFGSVLANNDIDTEISSKKIHALLGENGAGKSTLVKILSGHYRPDSGEIFINDKKLELGSTSSSLKNGIGILSQDPLDFQNLSIKESFIAGSKKFGENFNEKKIELDINKAFKKYEIKLNLNQKIRSLSIGERQQIELIRLLFENSKIIILDEPTNGFSLTQRDLVFKMLKTLSSEGYIVILVSHKLDEVFELCQEATILKNGEKIKTIPIPYDRNKIIDLMFQGEQKKIISKNSNKNLTPNGYISIDLKEWGFNESKIDQGSKVGVIGLQGSGADQFVRDIFEKKINIQNFYNNNQSDIPKQDIYYTPSDRLERGLFGELNINEHVALASKGNKLISWKSINNSSGNLIKEYEIKGNPNILANQLSGGNQQKLQLALIPKSPGLLLLEQPTRGLDVKSTGSVWEKIIERARADISVIFSTTDIDEVWEQSDWIICFSGEKITNISKKSSMKKDDIKFLISGLESRK